MKILLALALLLSPALTQNAWQTADWDA